MRFQFDGNLFYRLIRDFSLRRSLGVDGEDAVGLIGELDRVDGALQVDLAHRSSFRWDWGEVADPFALDRFVGALA